MRDWKSGGGAKIKRAKEHIAEFDSASQEFFKAHPYTAISQFNPQSRDLDFVVQSAQSIDPRLAAITADAIHDLRAPLDILWHQVWSKGAPGYRKHYFPFLDSAHELETRFRSVKQAPHKAAVDILRVTKSYKSANKLLWALNEVETRDKHELPLLAAASYKQVVMRFPPDIALYGKPGGWAITAEVASGFLFLEHGTELPIVLNAETDAGPIVEMECDLTADIAFGQGEVLQGEPVLKTLHEMAQLVEGIVSQFLAAGLIR